jgi:hypothetical protein
MDRMKATDQVAIDTAYNGFSNGDDFARVFSFSTRCPGVQQQLLNAGIRLAKIIDENY